MEREMRLPLDCRAAEGTGREAGEETGFAALHGVTVPVNQA